jgi:hypothetical protein
MSSLTLAFLQDMGYYRANLTAAETLLWGYGKGCTFYTGPCVGSSWESPYSCTTNNHMVCGRAAGGGVGAHTVALVVQL